MTYRKKEMDVNVRSGDGNGGEEKESCAVDWFAVLPEGCIANVLSLTSPGDACRLSLLTSTFRWAALSDVVWEKFLPCDYQDIIARRHPADDAALAFSTKKELYLHLCDHPLIIDGGAKSFSLEKFSGKKCYMLAATELSIVWGATTQYWRWIPLPESRFAEVAKLIGVQWLEIRGKIDTCILSPNTTYGAYLVFKITAGAYGFDYQPAEVSVGISGDESETQRVYLDPEGVDGHYPEQRGDGWLEIKMGQYVNTGGEDGELEMSLMDVEGSWKHGLIVEGIEIRPERNL